MAEINLQGAFSFLDSLKKIAVAGLIILVGFALWIFQEDISQRISGDKLLIIEETVQLTDDDILAVGYWKLDKKTDKWECAFSVSLSEHDFCKQTGSFHNDPFVRKFQIQLERDDVIVVEVTPDTSTFERYWRGTYKAIFGINEAMWGPPLYVIYFQVGDTDDLRRVIYSLDPNDAHEGRVLTTYYKEVILSEL